MVADKGSRMLGDKDSAHSWCAVREYGLAPDGASTKRRKHYVSSTVTSYKK